MKVVWFVRSKPPRLLVVALALPHVGLHGADQPQSHGDADEQDDAGREAGSRQSRDSSRLSDDPTSWSGTTRLRWSRPGARFKRQAWSDIWCRPRLCRGPDREEVQKFHGYVLAVQEHFSTSSDRPTIRGLMIAQGYSPQAELIRANLEEVPVPRMRFRTWDRVIDETKRLHLGWLNVSRRRVGGL